MRVRILELCVLAIVVSSCTPVSTAAPSSDSVPLGSSPTSVFTSSVPTPILVNTQSLTESNTGFIEPDPETYVAVFPAVLEYFYHRKKAMISGNVEDLWARYPDLRKGMDSAKGINAEEFFISNYRGLKLFDGNISPEAYERFKVKQKNDKFEVLVHGMELYLFLDESGQFNESGGEFKIILYLRMKDGHWNVWKTDEVMQSEWQAFSP